MARAITITHRKSMPKGTWVLSLGEYDKHSHCEYQYQVVPPAPARSGVGKGIVSGQRCLNLSMIHTIAFTFALAAAEVCGANHMVDEFVLDSIQPGGAGKSQT